MLVSIFNDVIGPVMRGPSSSHCAAALRIGRLARDLMGGEFQEVRVEYDRHGSLATTHADQGSDMGLFGGLLGWDADDARLPDSASALQKAGIRLRVEIVESGHSHPNTYQLILSNGREQNSLRAVSAGGGMVELVEVNGFRVSMFGDCYETLFWMETGGRELAQQLAALLPAGDVLVHEAGGRRMVEVKAREFVSADLVSKLGNAGSIRAVSRLSPVLPVISCKGARVPFTTCAEMLQLDSGRNTPLWQLAVEYECQRGALTGGEVIGRMRSVVRLLRRSIDQGIAGTQYEDRVLGHQSGRFQKLLNSGRLLDGGVLNRAVLYVSALMEVKSAMGVIVAAPTAGACGALPGVVMAVAEDRDLGEEEMAKALLAAGLIGVFIATRWTFSAEVGGCQAETGAASSMAAAALVSMAGGTLLQSVGAASMALQNMIGLVCDPVANRVEVPCLGKNVMAASNAIACANLALAGYDPVIPLDEVIEAAQRVGSQMPRELRCTALGGLSVTPTSKAIERTLAMCRTHCGSH